MKASTTYLSNGFSFSIINYKHLTYTTDNDASVGEVVETQEQGGSRPVAVSRPVKISFSSKSNEGEPLILQVRQ